MVMRLACGRGNLIVRFAYYIRRSPGGFSGCLRYLTLPAVRLAGGIIAACNAQCQLYPKYLF